MVSSKLQVHGRRQSIPVYWILNKCSISVCLRQEQKRQICICVPLRRRHDNLLQDQKLNPGGQYSTYTFV